MDWMSPVTGGRSGRLAWGLGLGFQVRYRRLDKASIGCGHRFLDIWKLANRQAEGAHVAGLEVVASAPVSPRLDGDPDLQAGEGHRHLDPERLPDLARVRAARRMAAVSYTHL